MEINFFTIIGIMGTILMFIALAMFALKKGEAAVGIFLIGMGFDLAPFVDFLQLYEDNAAITCILSFCLIGLGCICLMISSRLSEVKLEAEQKTPRRVSQKSRK